MKALLAIFLSVILFVSCSSNGGSDVAGNTTVADYEFAPVNATDSANYIVFTSTSKGQYHSLAWNFPDETIQNDSVVTYYFPQKGTYKVTLRLWQADGTNASVSKDVVIAADDPAYVPNKLVWSDEFDGDTLNTDNWSYETNVDVNNEWEKYTTGTQNITVKNGILTITAKKIGAGQHKYDYTSGRINTAGKHEFLYGRMEIRAKLPSGTGTWPAIWMLGSDIGTVGWPACGELDIMEHVGYDPLWIQGSIHTPSSYGNTVNNGRLELKDCESAFHVYGMTWTPDKIEYYIDDPTKPYYVYNPSVKNDSTWPFNKPCFFILNLAIGGTWGGAKGVDDSIFPVQMQVDYVRVYSYK